METTVISLLKTTPQEYETFLMDFYFDWCSKKANSNKDLQKLLTCQPLFNWWQCQLQQMEGQFVEDAHYYAHCLATEDAYKLYRINTQQLYNLFSKPLIQKAYDR
ncbi:MAG TPA: hypothetical protein PKC63_15405 [Mariniflexile sp.]|jgi:hypothetical protein|nr:hypothetical protein [Mariniflexile sp.]